MPIPTSPHCAPSPHSYTPSPIPTPPPPIPTPIKGCWFFQSSNLSITTCHKSENIGARIEYDHNGHITKQQATARTHGTTVTLQNLFSTLPVRHKEFLRNIKREYTKMMQVLQGYCVISTGARISCHNIGEKGKKSLALATHGNIDMRENISNVFGPRQVSLDSGTRCLSRPGY